jgi:hypothetical protein
MQNTPGMRPEFRVAKRWKAKSLFYNDTIANIAYSGCIPGDVSSPALQDFRIHKSAQLDHALKCFHFHVLEIPVLPIICQRCTNTRRSGVVVYAFSAALRVAIAGTSGYTDEQGGGSETEDQSQRIQGLVPIWKCF